MDYELLQKLKEAGFPLKTTTTMGGLVPETTVNPDTALVGPTLSELIEACGNKFISLRVGLGCWFAEGERNSEFKEVQGSTPEETVAKLYLALNEKEQPHIIDWEKEGYMCEQHPDQVFEHDGCIGPGIKYE